MPSPALRQHLGRALLVLSTAALGACASTPAGPIWAPLEDPALQAYAQDLVCRIAPRCTDHPVLLVDMPEAQAEALPDGRIALRKGLLLAVEEEAELVFVLAHEIAHRQLGHRAPRTLEARLPLELQADAVALRTLVRLGYPPDAGTRLITRIRPERIDSERHRIALEQIEARVSALPAPSSRAAQSGPLDDLLRRHRNVPQRP
jgi:predicted Zn-dependent protease